MANDIRSENDTTDVAQVEAKTKNETASQWIVLKSMDLYRFCRVARDCVTTVKKFPTKLEANMRDFIQLEA
ncbi:MAG: hypothetical protein LBE98_03410 [Puniceicoccales bacterium]|jgi:hypothetical protein|nr:hypothetical protein [Puniceicoccales bacterium]